MQQEKRTHIELNFEERKRIEEGLQKGCSIGTISVSLSRAISCIRAEVSRNGGIGNYSADVAEKRALAYKKARGSKVTFPMTPEQEILFDEGISAGLTIVKLSAHVGVSHHKIKAVLFRRGISLRKNRSEINTLEDRIQALEQQMQILADIITEIKP